MNGKTGKTMRRIGAIAMSTVMSFALIPSLQGVPEVKADTWTKDKTNTWIGAQALQNPKQPTSKNDPWTGDYVYYGKHDGQPVLFRVLSKRESKLYNNVFLDCDSVLCKSVFDDESGIWNVDSCDIRNALPGKSILELTAAEKRALSYTSINEHALSGIDNKVISRFGSYSAMKYDQVFLMDVEDVLNKQYGYWNESGMGQANTSVVSRQKKEFGKSTGEPVAWSLRNTVASDNTRIGIVGKNGTISDLSCQTECGISPAMNIDEEDILFATLVDGTKGEPGATYKLTVIDNEIDLDNLYGEQITFDGNTVTVPFRLTGWHNDKVNRISLLITDNPIEDSSQQDITILEYCELPVTGDLKNGTVTFTIPDNLGEMDEDFYVYIVPETINGKYETDYTRPVRIWSPRSTEFDLMDGEISIDQIKWDSIWWLYECEKLSVEYGIENGNFSYYIDLDQDGNVDLFAYITEAEDKFIKRAETCNIFGTYKYELEDSVPEYYGVTSITFKLPLCQPTITKAEPTDTGVQVKWNKVSGYSTYNVYRSTSENGTYSYLASVTGGTTKYVDKTAQGGKTYYYKVRPYKKTDGKTIYAPWSDAAKVVVLADTKLTAEPKSGVTMKLSWTAVSGATSYEIYRSTSASGPYTYVKATTGTSTSDTGLTAGTRYYY
ncbi:MAG: hypothetical protein IK125_01045, partial [Lachnospiraceae bacterium]|nr:hypothetical protein [Lachnospiraceae bacterium]